MKQRTLRKDSRILLKGRKDPRVRSFTRTVGPQVASYIKDEPACVVSSYSGGIPFGTDLREYLLPRNPNVTYAELDVEGRRFRLHRDQVGGRIVIIADDGINSAATYNALSATIARQNREYRLGIKEVRWAVDYDKVGIADFARIKGVDDIHEAFSGLLDSVENTARYICDLYRTVTGNRNPEEKYFAAVWKALKGDGKEPAPPKYALEVVQAPPNVIKLKHPNVASSLPPHKASNSADCTGTGMTRRDSFAGVLGGLAALGGEICDKKK